MGQFDFVGDESLRDSLEADYEELQNCLSAQSWKAVHVIAGSIIEAVLIDHLLAIRYSKADPLKLTLDQALHACKEENVISQRVVDLSNVIRSYRNLIHPGRALRLNDTVDAESAKVAEALVNIVVRDISSRKSASYGYTAEQIVSKLQRDPSARAILDNLLAELNKSEKEKLLLIILPDKYLEMEQSPFRENDVLLVWKECFYRTFDSFDDSTKSKVADKFAIIVKEGSKHDVVAYADTFFTASHIRYISSPSDRATVKTHLLSRLANEQSVSIFRVLIGIHEFLDKKDVEELTNSFLRFYIKIDTATRIRILDFFINEYCHLPDDLKNTALGVLKGWESRYRRTGQDKWADLVSDLMNYSINGLPF